MRFCIEQPRHCTSNEFKCAGSYSWRGKNISMAFLKETNERSIRRFTRGWKNIIAISFSKIFLRINNCPPALQSSIAHRVIRSVNYFSIIQNNTCNAPTAQSFRELDHINQRIKKSYISFRRPRAAFDFWLFTGNQSNHYSTWMFAWKLLSSSLLIYMLALHN